MPGQRNIAIKLMQKQQFAEALPILLHLIENDSDDGSLYYMAGQCFRFTNNIPEAVNFLTKAASFDQSEPQIFHALGIALQLAKEYELAIEKLEYAVDLEPRLFSAYNSIGSTYRKLGKFSEAIKWYSKAIDGISSTVNEEVHKDREKCYRNVVIDGMDTRVVLPYVLERTHELLQADPLYAIIKNNLGVCLIDIGDLDSAREQFKESIEFIPDGYNYPDPFKNLESIG